ncbi:CoA transferase [Frankia sp. CcI49]|uniref:CaiB/BaiF CoA transferase family protein n=1 Tax=Frankia sp. CcI49 TaxID=1745382 RepID=UPI000976A4D1|nr:CoA transferase [Frankia sp. CcI49]
MNGVRVVEAGWFASAPSCATILADWGAQVIKLEPPGGEPGRATLARSGPSNAPLANPRFDVHNRSRRSVVLNLLEPGPRRVAHQLVRGCDVFVTNLRPSVLRQIELDSATLRADHPRLIYAHVTGYGDDQVGQRRSYDLGAFWAYSGLASLSGDATGRPPHPATGMGDRAGGAALAGAVSAALFQRERTGEGTVVTVSLLRTAMWLMASDVADALHRDDRPYPTVHETTPKATLNCYRCADGRWIWLQVLFPARDWYLLLDVLDAHWLDEDPRFHGGEPTRLAQHSEILVETLEEIFRHRTAAEWAKRLAAAGLPFTPVQNLPEALADPVVHASGAFLDIPLGTGTYRSVNSPVDFAGADLPASHTAPQVGADTEQVLTELGLSPAQIAEIRATEHVHGPATTLD